MILPLLCRWKLLSVCLKGIYNPFVQIFLNWTRDQKATRALVSLERTSTHNVLLIGYAESAE